MSLVTEHTLETRVGLEAALRHMALGTGHRTDHIVGASWTLDSASGHRHELTRVDRIVVALLSEDPLAAGHDLDQAGPVGTALICLRCAVQARRLAPTPDAPCPGRKSARPVRRSEHYLHALKAAVLIPAPDRHVWDSAIDPAQALFTDMATPQAVTHSPGSVTVSPLAHIAATMVTLPLLARRAFAAVFAAGLADTLLLTAPPHPDPPHPAPAGPDQALVCARRHAALTVAYLTGDRVQRHHRGGLRIVATHDDT